ncbi:hypothetical protein C8R48DRAFT_805997 [Suillus tomentosus]|nr:hypothetical protein C8R48DRAFT_805997 [Suillus tomentosus]
MAAYYSSDIFVQSGFTQVSALASSLGFRALNWLFAIPAFFTIDTYRRRNLLLFTLPSVSDLFVIFYYPGKGPVPFTYSTVIPSLYP